MTEKELLEKLSVPFCPINGCDERPYNWLCRTHYSEFLNSKFDHWESKSLSSPIQYFINKKNKK